jgi:hypothetical protein
VRERKGRWAELDELALQIHQAVGDNEAGRDLFHKRLVPMLRKGTVPYASTIADLAEAAWAKSYYNRAVRETDVQVITYYDHKPIRVRTLYSVPTRDKDGNLTRHRKYMNLLDQPFDQIGDFADPQHIRVISNKATLDVWTGIAADLKRRVPKAHTGQEALTQLGLTFEEYLEGRHFQAS